MDKKTLLKKFGKNVKIERIKRDLTQENLAEILDVNSNYIACIECGRQNMSLGKILELSNALDTNIENLLKFSD
jgi:transcriptional regulator with XRE-family HTH domain